MNIHIVTFAYKLAHEFEQDFHAADAENVTWHVFLHSQRSEVVEVCERLSARPNVNYYPYGVDRGLARSLNEGVMAAQDAGADALVMLCDDLLAGPGDIQRLATAILEHPDCAYIDGNAFVERVERYEPSQLDAAALNLRTFEKIGYFDVNFWPMNFEDVDWKYRARLAGFTHMTLPDTHFVHRATNANTTTPEELSERMEKFYRTRAYYEAKWGGDQHQERYSVPFNNSNYDLIIGRQNVENPYPSYRRVDIPEYSR